MDKLHIVSTIEARMTSSRLPGKVLLKTAGKPLLQILIERLSKSKLIDEIVVATTINSTDDVIANLCDQMNVKCFRGSELNVLERITGAARSAVTDILVQITGDCPLIDPILVDEAINIFIQRFPDIRYVSNTGPYISMPWGFDVQVYMASDLYAINDNAPDEMDKEHVSYSFYSAENIEKYKPFFIKYIGELNRPELRVTLDYHDDYTLIKEAYESLHENKPDFTAIDVIRWLDKNPVLRDAAINCRIRK